MHYFSVLGTRTMRLYYFSHELELKRTAGYLPYTCSYLASVCWLGVIEGNLR